MSRPLGRSSGWLAASALAAMVIAVFFVLQNYGPESAVRRFHEALLRNDAAELRAVTNPGSGDALQAVASVAYRAMQAADSNRIVRREDAGGKVLVEVAYLRGGRILAILPWVARRAPGGWLVDPLETYYAMSRYIAL